VSDQTGVDAARAPVESAAGEANRDGPSTRSGGIEGVTIGVAALIVFLDQTTKALVRATIPLHSSRTIIDGVLDFTHVQNTGAAFGFLNAVDFPYKPTVIALVATAALISIAIYAARLSPHQRLARLGLAFILGGATGNLIDRVVAGHVVDFVDVYWRTYHFWAFNVADSAITVGVVGMMLEMLGIGNRKTP
jgi:signal peptidase II